MQSVGGLQRHQIGTGGRLPGSPLLRRERRWAPVACERHSGSLMISVLHYPSTLATTLCCVARKHVLQRQVTDPLDMPKRSSAAACHAPALLERCVRREEKPARDPYSSSTANTAAAASATLCTGMSDAAMPQGTTPDCLFHSVSQSCAGGAADA